MSPWNKALSYQQLRQRFFPPTYCPFETGVQFLFACSFKSLNPLAYIQAGIFVALRKQGMHQNPHAFCLTGIRYCQQQLNGSG